MIETVKEHLQKVAQFEATDQETIEQFRISYAGKKGILNDLFAAFRAVPNEEKKEFGQVLNQLKAAVSEKIETLKASQSSATATGVYGDLSRPAFPSALGSQHPLTVVRNRIVDIFSQIGFNISEGPEIEDDWHNFTALNLPECRIPFLFKPILIFCYAHIRHLYKCAIWKIINLLFVQFLLGVFLETKLFLLERTVFSIK